MKPAAPPVEHILDRLKYLARAGQVLIDGDACQNALRPPARNWTDGDDLDYDFEVSVPLKKTLLHLERLEGERGIGGVRYYAVIWRPRPDRRGEAEVLLAGSATSPYGRGPMPMPPPLRRALLEGKTAVGRIPARRYLKMLQRRFGHVWMVDRDNFLRSGLPQVLSVFAPIHNSLGRVVAALELTTAGRDG